MRFGSAGEFMYVASNHQIGLRDAAERPDKIDAADGTSYSFEISEPGVLLLLRNGAPFQHFRCDTVKVADADALAGDIVLSNAPGMPSLRRVQRKLR